MCRKRSSELLQVIKSTNWSYNCAYMRVYGVVERLYITVFCH